MNEWLTSKNRAIIANVKNKIKLGVLAIRPKTPSSWKHHLPYVVSMGKMTTQTDQSCWPKRQMACVRRPSGTKDYRIGSWMLQAFPMRVKCKRICPSKKHSRKNLLHFVLFVDICFKDSIFDDVNNVTSPNQALQQRRQRHIQQVPASHTTQWLTAVAKTDAGAPDTLVHMHTNISHVQCQMTSCS